MSELGAGAGLYEKKKRWQILGKARAIVDECCVVQRVRDRSSGELQRGAARISMKRGSFTKGPFVMTVIKAIDRNRDRSQAHVHDLGDNAHQ